MKEFSKEKVLFILHIMIGMLFSPLMQLEIIIYGHEQVGKSSETD